MGNPPSLDISDRISVSAWVYAVPLNSIIAEKHGGNSDYGWMLALNESYVSSSFEWRISTTDSDWNGGFTTPGSFIPDAWNHVVATYDGTRMRVYINGEENLGGDFPHSLTGPIHVSTASTRIGSTYTNASNLNGRLDDVKIFNYALTAEQVKTLYNNSSAVSF